MDFFESFSFFSLIFTLIIVIIIILLCIQLTNFLLNLTADKVTIDATLISKDSAKNYHYNDHGGTWTTTFSFTFETINGERVILDVSYKTFRQYGINDFGELTYQRKWLKEFSLKS
ncbi:MULTISPECIES: DUF2500 family protein [Vagococcus]|uniref:DUF2500 family protein n=1 Tax=Vagococcus TaxID=2737 RepID=UPI002FCBC504